MGANRFFQARGSAISLKNIANLERWIEPSLESYSDDDLVGQLTDWSGKGKHLTASGSDRGVFKTNIVNGLAVLRLDGTRRYASIGGKADDNFKHRGDFTIIKVIRSNVDNATHTFFDSGASTNSAVGFLSNFKIVASGVNGGYQTLVANGSGTYLLNLNLPITPYGAPTPKDQWLILVERYEQAKAQDNLTVERDNLLVGALTDTGTPSAADSTNDPAWFSTAAGISKGNFDLAFLAEFSRALTDNQINQIIGSTL
jgi:hypothetical protein